MVPASVIKCVIFSSYRLMTLSELIQMPCSTEQAPFLSTTTKNVLIFSCSDPPFCTVPLKHVIFFPSGGKKILRER